MDTDITGYQAGSLHADNGAGMLPPDENSLKAALRAEVERLRQVCEADKPVFRVSDLRPEAQYKLASLLKERSTLRSVRRLDAAAILESLRTVDPPVVFASGFSYSQMPRWIERHLSQAAYYLKCRRPSSSRSAALTWLARGPWLLSDVSDPEIASLAEALKARDRDP